MKSSKSNTKIPVATNFFEASSLRHFSQRLQLRGGAGDIEIVYKFDVFHKSLLR